MGNDTANVELKLKATADTVGVQQMRSEFDGLMEELKAGVANALKGEGVDSQFISHVTAEFDKLNEELKATGASGDEVTQKIAKLEQELTAAAAAEQKRVQQLKVNFEMALHDKDVQEEAAANQRRRREEDQLRMEQEGKRLQENTQKLEQELQAAAAAELKRIEQLKQGMTQALAEKDAEQEALELSRRRKQEDQLAAEQEAIAARRRIAALQEERELAKSVAMARQMSAEQRIERGVMGKGAYDPREDVERLKQVDAQTSRNIAAMRGYQGSVGDAALAFAYFADDAQYGLRGIMNNIPQLALMLGLGSGLAGTISVAAVAVNVLWEKFGGAKEAAKQTDEAKQRTEELTGAINDATAAASALFNQNFDKYLAGLREATELWATQKGHISEALAYQNELAKAEQAAAQAKLEIERQNKLAGAKSDEERKMINAEYDVRKAGIAQSGQKEAMDRAIESQQLSENSLKARIGDATGAKDSAQQTAGNLNAANQGIVGGIGQQSDQARRERERAENEARIGVSENDMAFLLRQQQQRGDPTKMDAAKLDEFYAAQAKIEALQKSISDSYKKRDELAVTQDSDREALKTGKGVTFDKAKGDAKEAGDTASVAKYTQAEQQLKDNAEAAAKATAEALEADKKITELKLELAALEKKGVLLKAQQQAQQLEADAAAAKQTADKNAAEQKADAEHLKKQREEQARKLENDAREMEKGGLFSGAAAKRNEAAKLRLKDDATPEERRQAEMEAKERLEEGSKKSAEFQRQKDAKELGNKTGNLGNNLGEAGKKLKEASDKLKDGATEKELEQLAEVIMELAPTLKSKFAGQEKEFSKMWQAIKTLTEQFKNART